MAWKDKNLELKEQLRSRDPQIRSQAERQLGLGLWLRAKRLGVRGRKTNIRRN